MSRRVERDDGRDSSGSSSRERERERDREGIRDGGRERLRYGDHPGLDRALDDRPRFGHTQQMKRNSYGQDYDYDFHPNRSPHQSYGMSQYDDRPPPLQSYPPRSEAYYHDNRGPSVQSRQQYAEHRPYSGPSGSDSHCSGPGYYDRPPPSGPSRPSQPFTRKRTRSPSPGRDYGYPRHSPEPVTYASSRSLNPEGNVQRSAKADNHASAAPRERDESLEPGEQPESPPPERSRRSRSPLPVNSVNIRGTAARAALSSASSSSDRATPTSGYAALPTGPAADRDRALPRGPKGYYERPTGPSTAKQPSVFNGRRGASPAPEPSRWSQQIPSAPRASYQRPSERGWSSARGDVDHDRRSYVEDTRRELERPPYDTYRDSEVSRGRDARAVARSYDASNGAGHPAHQRGGVLQHNLVPRATEENTVGSIAPTSPHRDRDVARQIASTDKDKQPENKTTTNLAPDADAEKDRQEQLRIATVKWEEERQARERQRLARTEQLDQSTSARGGLRQAQIPPRGPPSHFAPPPNFPLPPPSLLVARRDDALRDQRQEQVPVPVTTSRQETADMQTVNRERDDWDAPSKSATSDKSQFQRENNDGWDLPAPSVKKQQNDDPWDAPRAPSPAQVQPQPQRHISVPLSRGPSGTGQSSASGEATGVGKTWGKSPVTSLHGQYQSGKATPPASATLAPKNNWDAKPSAPTPDDGWGRRSPAVTPDETRNVDPWSGPTAASSAGGWKSPRSGLVGAAGASAAATSRNDAEQPVKADDEAWGLTPARIETTTAAKSSKESPAWPTPPQATPTGPKLMSIPGGPATHQGSWGSPAPGRGRGRGGLAYRGAHSTPGHAIPVLKVERKSQSLCPEIDKNIAEIRKHRLTTLDEAHTKAHVEMRKIMRTLETLEAEVKIATASREYRLAHLKSYNETFT